MGACAGGGSGSAPRSSGKGDELFNRGDYPKAIAEYDGVVRKDGRNTHAMFQMGLCWEKLANADAAIPWYDKVLSIAPNSDDGKKAAQRRERLVRLKNWDPSQGPPPAELID